MARAVALAPEGATVALATSTPFIRLLSAEGQGAVEERTRTLHSLASRFDISEESLIAEGARVPHELSLEIMTRYAWMLGTEAIVLRALGTWKLGDHGIGDYLNATCASTREVMATVTEFVGLLHDGIRFSSRTDGERTHLNCELDTDVAYHRWVPESALGKVVVELQRAFAPGPVPGIRAIHFSHAAPTYEQEYRGFFKVPVEFSQGEDAIVFDTSALEVPLPTADPILHGLLLRQASAMLPTRRAKRSLLDRVRVVAREELATSFGDQSRVAQRLGMSSATLRRRLEHEHNARYANILSDLRRDIAVTCLAESSISIEEIGRRAGFSQKTAFYRAFKRWLGCTPAEYRRANRTR